MMQAAGLVKQSLLPLTEPLGALWLFMALGVVWLVWRRQWRSAVWLGIPTFVLFVIGSTPLVEMLVASEEQQWTASFPPSHRPTVAPSDRRTVVPSDRRADVPSVRRADPPSSDVVVALGAGYRISQYDALGFAACDGSSRLLTAIELVRQGRAKTVVLGGSWQPLPGQTNIPSMSLIQDWVHSWSLTKGEVMNLGLCKDTHDEAISFKRLAEGRGWSRVILVTSALHLRRSEAAFRKQGVDVVPVAADFMVCGVPQDRPFSPFPRGTRFYLLSLYLHEKIGWWVYRWRGWI